MKNPTTAKEATSRVKSPQKRRKSVPATQPDGINIQGMQKTQKIRTLEEQITQSINVQTN